MVTFKHGSLRIFRENLSNIIVNTLPADGLAP